jgi:hypothetical protein
LQWSSLDRLSATAHHTIVPDNVESPLDVLWKEYGQVFAGFDDLSLGRWLSQTLSQIEGKAWRMSHPLLGAYRLAAQLGHDRHLWFTRLVAPPNPYTEAQCCRAPTLPLLTRDVPETGLICHHCNETLVPFEEIAKHLQEKLGAWAAEYGPVHAVAHWDDRQRKSSGDYEGALENAAEQGQLFLRQAGKELAPALLEIYPAVVWEDQDECLDIRPEDVSLKSSQG